MDYVEPKVKSSRSRRCNFMQGEPCLPYAGIGRLQDSIKQDETHLRAAPLGPRQKIWLQRSIQRDKDKLKELRRIRKEYKKREQK